MANNTPQQNAAARHQLYVERLAATNANTLDPELKALASFLRSRLAEEGGSISSVKAMNAVVSDVRKRFGSTYDKWVKQTKDFIVELTAYETTFQTNALNVATTDDFKPDKPTNKSSKSKVTNTPLLVGANGGAVDQDKLISNFSKTETDKVESLIKTGYYQGLTTAAIIGSIVGTKANNYKDGIMVGTKRNATAISKTSAVHASTITKDNVWKSNDGAVQGYIITAVLDSSTSKKCRGLDDTYVKWGDSFQPRPPFHVNCLIGDTNVTTCSSVSRVFKRWYEGEAINIRTKSGRAVTITPNHPVLTDAGWLEAKFVNSGNKLVTIADGANITDHHKDSVEAKISDIFGSLDVSGNSSFVAECPASAEYFHGDMTDGEVGVIDVNSLAWNRVKASASQSVENKGFIFRSRIASAFKGFRSLNLAAMVNNPSKGGFIGRFRDSLFLIGSTPIHSGLLLLASTSDAAKLFFNKCNNWAFGAFKAEMLCNSTGTDSGQVGANYSGLLGVGESDRSTSDRDSSFLDNSADDAATAIKSFTDGSKRKPAFIKFDDVVSVTVKRISEHVYNLENENNWYLSEGIITHNCRTTTIPWLREDLDAVSNPQRETKGADGKEYEPTAKQYYPWLKQQPAWFQDDVLGKTEGKIFRNAGLTPEQFRAATIKQDGTPLTISEMAAKDSQINDYLAKSE